MKVSGIRSERTQNANRIFDNLGLDKVRDIDFADAFNQPTNLTLNEIKKRFAWVLYSLLECLKEHGNIESHEAVLNLSRGNPLTIKANDISKIKTFLLDNNIDWELLLKYTGLISGLRRYNAANITSAFTILLGEINPASGAYGNTDIKPEMILERRTSLAKLNLLGTKILNQTEEDIPSLEIKDIGDSRTIFERIKAYAKERRLKSDFGNVLRACSKAEHEAKDCSSTLEKLLQAKVNEKYILTEHKLSTLLVLLKEKILEMTNLPKIYLTKAKEYLGQLYKHRNHGETLRTILLAAIKYDPQSTQRLTPIGIIDRTSAKLLTLHKASVA